MVDLCNKIKNELVKYSKDRPIDESTEPHILELVNDINEFSHGYKKRKPKKSEKPTPVEAPPARKQHKNPFDIAIEGPENGQKEAAEPQPKKF